MVAGEQSATTRREQYGRALGLFAAALVDSAFAGAARRSSSATRNGHCEPAASVPYRRSSEAVGVFRRPSTVNAVIVAGKDGGRMAGVNPVVVVAAKFGALSPGRRFASPHINT